MENQPKKKSPVGIILLIILALIVGGGFYLYYSIAKAPLELDDPKAMAAAAPMSLEERFTFSAADRTANIKVDTRDFWNLILDHAGEDFLDVVNKEVSSYGLTVSGCAIHMDEEGLRLDLELFYKEKRLVAKVPCQVEFSGRNVSLTPSGVKVGVISLPVKGLLSNLKLSYDLDLPVISGVTRVDFVRDALVLTGPVEDIRALIPREEMLQQAQVFSEEMQPLAKALGSQEGMDEILAHLERNPGSVEQLYHDLFVLAGPEVTKTYLDSRYGLTQRFLGDLDPAELEAEHVALTEMLKANTTVLEQFFTKAVNTYNDKKFVLSEGQFLLNKKPFQAAEFGGEQFAELFQLLDPESFHLILVDAADGHVRKTSSFYRMADENQQFTQAVDFNKTYILGCLFRGLAGDFFLLYESEVESGNTYSRLIKLLPVTEETAQELQVSGVFGVWTGEE